MTVLIKSTKMSVVSGYLASLNGIVSVQDILDTIMQISNLKSKISKLEMKLRRKEEFKQIALGTSKLNYMDPRITVGWCKKNEVPIDKIFTKSIRDKFPWAMYCKPDYNF